jgi:peptide/nickel transport system substrate-binding protein
MTASPDSDRATPSAIGASRRRRAMKIGKPQHRILALSLVAAIAGVSFAASISAGWAGASSKYPEYPRAKSLITFGTQYGDYQGFNPFTDSYATGTVGLCNETLLRYDPLKDKYINWLAKSASFTSAKAFTVKVRPGIKWSNGKKFTAKDVAWNYKLGRFSSASWNTLWKSVKFVRVKGNTVKFSFKGTPNYVQWQNLIWNLPLISPQQGRAITSAASLTAYSPSDPVGTGPYKLDVAGYEPATRVVWKKKADWWATKQKLAPSPGPTYIIDLNNNASVTALGALLGGIRDLTNNFQPGIQTYVKQGTAQTYYSRPPYNLSANTAWLEVNTTKPALNNKAFRKALATSIDSGRIVGDDFGSLVLKANATGLLPTWNKWVDQKQLKSLGFKYRTGTAKSLLAAAGYKDVNGDGYVETPSGAIIDLKFAVPQGWSDWESARDLIIASAKAAGIRLHKDEGDYNHWLTERKQGLFDLAIDNSPQLSDNPWTYFDFLFHLPTGAGGFGQTSANYSRYANVKAWNLVKKLDRTQPNKTAVRKSIAHQLEKIFLTDLPSIPLWYGGVWSQSQSKTWTNWPSANSKRNYVPTMWRGYMQMTGIDMITHLKRA